jgi:outer membrane lipoprotein carrier protein
MPRAFLLLVLVLALTGPAPGAEVMDRVGAAYAGLSSLTASFSQEVFQPRLARTRRSSGTVAYQKPRKVRWEYLSGQEGLLVGDGVSWFWHEPSEKQVVITPYRADAGWEEILFDPSRAGGTMNVVESRLSAGEWEVRLVPKDSASLTRVVTLFVDDRTAMVVGAAVEDVSGTRTGIRLTNVRPNAAVRGADFAFRPPPGTRIVEGR